MARVLDLHSIQLEDSAADLRIKLQSNIERLQRMADALFSDQRESWGPVSKDGLSNISGNLHITKGELRISSGGVRGQNEGGFRRTIVGSNAWLEYSHDGVRWYKFSKGTEANGVVSVYDPSIGGPVLTTPSFGLALNYRTVSSSTSAVTTDDVIRVNAGSGTATVTLFDPSVVPSKVIYVKKIDATANKVTIDGGAFDIDFATSIDLTLPWQTVVLHSITTGWELLPGY